jgi:hypothetical protein
MTELLPVPKERSRNAHSLLLQAMQPSGTGVELARVLDITESAVSRTKSELEQCLAIIYQLGFKVVPSDKVCVDKAMYESLTTIASKAMANQSIAHQLMWDDE